MPFDYDWCGFNVIADGNDFKIDRVLRGTSASDAALQVGDLILAVDGTSVSELKLAQLRRLFKQDGRERVLSLRRHNDVVVIQIAHDTNTLTTTSRLKRTHKWGLTPGGHSTVNR